MKPTLEKIEALTPELDELFSGVSDPLNEWPTVRADVYKGRAQLYSVHGKSYLIIKRDGDDLLVLAYVGCDVNTATEICIEIARQSGMDSVRFYTARKGLARLLKQHQPELIQTCYRIAV